eukprot:364904-Chlamydomonas_euryale.AAC.8
MKAVHDVCNHPVWRTCRKAVSALAESERQSNASDAEVVRLAGALQQKGHDCESTERRLAAAECEVHSIKQRVLQKERDVANLEAEVMHLSRHTEELQGRLATQQAETATAKASFTDVHEQLARLKVHHHDLQERAHTAESQRALDAKQQLQQAYNVDAISMDLAAAMSQAQQSQERVSKKDAEIRCAALLRQVVWGRPRPNEREVCIATSPRRAAHSVSSGCCVEAVISRSVASAMILRSPGSPGRSFLDVAWRVAVAKAKCIAEYAEAAKAVQTSCKQSKMSAFPAQLTPNYAGRRSRQRKRGVLSMSVRECS